MIDVVISPLKVVWGLLQTRHRKKAIGIAVMMFIGTILELFSVALIVPLIKLLSDFQQGASTPVILWIIEVVGDVDRTTLIWIGLIGVTFIFTCKNAYLAVLGYMQASYAHDIRKELAYRLFHAYLFKPYTFHLQRNTAQLIQRISVETSHLSSGVLLPLLLFFTEGMIAIGISILVLSFTSIMAVFVLLLIGVGSGLLFKILRKRLIRWGKLRQYHEGMRIQQIQQGLGGIKDAKLLGREQSFLDAFEWHNVASAEVNRNQDVAAQLPRLWIETLAMFGLIATVCVLWVQGMKWNEIFPLLGLFAIAAFRLAPSMNRILGALQQLRFNFSVVEIIDKELKAVEEGFSAVAAKDESMPVKLVNALELENVSYQYPQNKDLSLQDINIEIKFGQTIGFVGSSGSGKSTLIDIIIGLLEPVKGKISIDGVDYLGCLRGWQNKIGYVPQTIYLSDESLRRNIAFGLSDDEIDESAVWRAIESAQLIEFVNSLPEGLDVIVGERGVRLSGGQRQRIGIARALYHDPQILVLDEATSALDSLTEAEVMEAINNFHGEKTILIVAHRLSTIKSCDVINVLEHGKLVAHGGYDYLLKNSSAFQMISNEKMSLVD